MTDTATTNAVETPEDLGGIVERWTAELASYEKAAKTWRKDSKDNYKRYSLRDRSDHPQTNADSRFNILWSNVQTQSPALFSRVPVPVVERRHRDKDPVARLASQMLERAIATDMEFDELEVIGKDIVLDFQVTARGVPWVRYDATIVEEEIQVFDVDGVIVDADGLPVEEEPEEVDDRLIIRSERIDRERAPVDYVFFDDFYHKPVKSWRENLRNGWVARRVFMTRRQGIRRFGDVFREVELTATPRGMEDVITEDMKPTLKMAEVFEIWDAADKEVIWISRGFKDRPLDRKTDPLELENFFPCPRPAFGTLTTDSLIPIPDYQQYINQADELDDLTERISVLTQALKMAGIYDASMEGLGALLGNDGPENIMIPVTNLAAYLAKGATGSKLTNVVQFYPVEIVAQVLLSLYDARDRVKQTLFEISGISDILRGQVDPRETLGQSRIKGQFATLRLDDRRQEIARMFRDTIRLKAEIIAEQFGDDMLRELSGFDQIPEIQSLMMLPDGQPNPEGPMIAEQRFQQAAALIRDDKTRGFRIDIESDSTVSVDEQETKDSRVEFLTAAGGFLQQAVLAGTQVPAMAPLLGEMMLFAVRGFKAGRPLEAAFEDAIEDLRNTQPSQGPSDTEIDAQIERAKLQVEQQFKAQELAQKREAQQAELALKAEIERMKLEIERQKLELQRQEAIAEANLDSETKTREGQLKIEVAQAELALKQQELELKRQELQIKREEAGLRAQQAMENANGRNGAQVSIPEINVVNPPRSRRIEFTRGADGITGATVTEQEAS